jgi:hypothetical protein
VEARVAIEDFVVKNGAVPYRIEVKKPVQSVSPEPDAASLACRSWLSTFLKDKKVSSYEVYRIKGFVPSF